MIIAVNTRVLSGNLITRKLLIDCFEMIAAAHPHHEFIFIAEKEPVKKSNNAKNIQWTIIAQQTGNPLLWKLWYNYRLPALLRKCKAEILISMDEVCCLSTGVPQCLLVNDLAFLQHPEWYSKKYSRFMQNNSAAFLQKAKSIISFSEILKNEIIQRYGADESKISVMHSCTETKYQPFSFEERENIKNRYSEGKEYFLFSGAVHPRSNLMNLLKAFSLFKKRQKSNMQLIIASENSAEDKPFIESLKSYKYRSEIKMLENLDAESLLMITASAYACTGLSSLHADIIRLLNPMQCGVPVIAGNSDIAVEILGNAALYVNASQPEDIAEKLMLLYKDEGKRNDVIKAGLQRTASCSMEDAAAWLWQNIVTAAGPA